MKLLVLLLLLGIASSTLGFAATRPPKGPPPSAVAGASPPSPTTGGPPRGGGPPGGGPPGSGGPPGTAGPGGLETFFTNIWPLLYLFDPAAKQAGVRDSSKNLRVLWTRALLTSLNSIDDPIAYDFLPRGTRNIVGKFAAGTIWKSSFGQRAVEKLDWIIKRTNFIDGQLDAFLDETSLEEGGERQVILLGAGYDTRSLRFQREGVQFFEVDLPDISSAKEAMIGQYFENKDETTTFRPKHVGFDLNTIATNGDSLVKKLSEKGLDVDPSVPTMVICEAVLFYLMPEAAQGLVGELFALPNVQRFCFTDNLAKVGVAPGPPVPTPKEKCEGWLNGMGKTLVEHDAIWGGAIHFVAGK